MNEIVLDGVSFILASLASFFLGRWTILRTMPTIEQVIAEANRRGYIRGPRYSEAHEGMPEFPLRIKKE